jgi:hypothetical protein
MRNFFMLLSFARERPPRHSALDTTLPAPIFFQGVFLLKRLSGTDE